MLVHSTETRTLEATPIIATRLEGRPSSSLLRSLSAVLPRELGPLGLDETLLPLLCCFCVLLLSPSLFVYSFFTTTTLVFIQQAALRRPFYPARNDRPFFRPCLLAVQSRVTLES